MSTRFRRNVSAAAALSLGAALALWAAPTAPRPRPGPLDALTASSYTATVSGRVMLPDGRPAAGFPIRVSRRSWGYQQPPAAVTDRDGQYTVSVPIAPIRSFRGPIGSFHAGSVFVSVDTGEGPYLQPEARVVEVEKRPQHTAAGVDFALALGPQITVLVRDAQMRQPVAGLAVQENTDMISGGDVGFHPAGVTDARGELRFRVSRRDVRLSANAAGVTPAVEAAPGNPFWTELHLAPGRDGVWELRTYRTDPAAELALWHGAVTGPDGRPVPGAAVHVLQNDRPEATTQADADGRFRLRLPREAPNAFPRGVGDVLVLAEKGALSGLLAPTPEQTWDGLPVKLSAVPWASYTGRVVGADGRPEAGVSVSCAGALADLPFGVTRRAEGGVTDADGRFVIPDVPPGAYQLHLGGGAFGTLALPPSDPGDRWKFDGLRLTTAQRRDLGTITVPRADAVLAGKIIRSDGKPVELVSLTVKGAYTDRSVPVSVYTGDTFALYHTVPEPLTLTVSALFPNGDGSVTEKPVAHVAARGGDTRVRIVLSPESMPPAPSPVPLRPAAPPAAGMTPARPTPRVIAAHSELPVDGLNFSIRPSSTTADPLQTAYEVTATNFAGVVWRGPLSRMDGMTLTVRAKNGVLKDRTGRTAWVGRLQDPTELTLLWYEERGRPTHLIVQDPQGKNLWSGNVPGIPVQARHIEDGFLSIIGPDHRILWECPYARNDVRHLAEDHGKVQAMGPDWPVYDSVIRFAAVPRKVVVQDAAGRVVWSGTPSLLVARDRAAEGPHSPLAMYPFDTALTVAADPGANLTTTLYDTQGRPARPFTYTPPERF